MSPRDPRIDDYIARAALFAQPLLRRLREHLHAAAPTLDESIRWGMPTFLHDGKIVASFAAFRQHASLNFWRANTDGAPRDGMGQFGRLRALDDLPDAATLAAAVHERIARIDAGERAAPRPRAPRPAPTVPEALQRALDAHPAARAAFEAFPPGHRREYVEWIVEAKREATRDRRIAQAVEWLADGKPRNWKYERR